MSGLLHIIVASVTFGVVVAMTAECTVIVVVVLIDPTACLIALVLRFCLVLGLVAIGMIGMIGVLWMCPH